jgi:histidyl-tRNA synthetase
MQAQMFKIVTPSEKELVLRPEGTAGIVRAMVNKKALFNEGKVVYSGPMFRYERPQKGRVSLLALSRLI